MWVATIVAAWGRIILGREAGHSPGENAPHAPDTTLVLGMLLIATPSLRTTSARQIHVAFTTTAGLELQFTSAFHGVYLGAYAVLRWRSSFSDNMQHLRASVERETRG